MGDEPLANEFREGTYKCVNCDALLYRSEDKFQSVGKWPAFRKPASAESVKYVEDMFGGSEIQCSKCDKHVGTLFHDGKKAGDSHPDAKERHCIESATVNFIVSNPAEIAPQLPQTPSKVTLNVSETLERPTTPPLGAPQNPKSNNKSKLNSSSNKNPLASSAKTRRPKDASLSDSGQIEQSGPSKTLMGAVAVAAVAIIGLGGYLGWKRFTSNKK
jgi:peptide-methionine (R)-S-oxide reductase